MLRSVPKEEWGEVRIKSAAIEGLTGRKPQYGLNRNWSGDYLSIVSKYYNDTKSMSIRFLKMK